MTKVRTIQLDYDRIEIHHNPLLKKDPYLIRVFNYNNVDPNEVRLSEEEYKRLFQTLKDYKLL